MISNKTANKFLTVANEKTVDLFFKSADCIDGKLKSQPSREAIFSKYKKLSSEDAVLLVNSIKDSFVLDEILVKEKRKTVLREIARNINLSLESRLYLYQQSIITRDYELKDSVLKNMDPKFLVEMYLNDTSNRDINENIIYEKLSLTNDKDLALRFFKLVGVENIYQLAPLNINLTNYLAKELQYKDSRKDYYYFRSNRYSQNDVSKEDLVEFLKHFKSKDAFSFVLNLNESREFLELMDKEFIAHYISGLHTFNTDTINLARKHELLELLADSRSNPETEEAAEELVNEVGPILGLRVLTNHPNSEKATITIKNSLDKLLLSGSSSLNQLLNSYVEKHIELFDLEQYWKVSCVIPDKEINPKIMERLLASGNSMEMIIETIPEKLLNNIKYFPREFDYEKFYIRVLDIADRKCKARLLAKIIDEITPNYGDEEKFNSEFANQIIKELHNIGEGSFIVDLFLRDRLGSETNKYISNIIRNDNILLEEAIRKAGTRNLGAMSSLIDKISPSTGWGNLLRSEDVISAVYNYLDSHFSVDEKMWETALTVFDDWRGTLPELVEMCKKI